MKNLILAAGLAFTTVLTPSTAKADHDHWRSDRPYYGYRYDYGPRYYSPRPGTYGYHPDCAYRYSMPYAVPYYGYRTYGFGYPYYYSQPAVSFGFTFIP